MTAPLIIAIGGHTLLDPSLPATVENQYAVCFDAMEPIAELSTRCEPLILVHGNGPQIGWMQLRNELSMHKLHRVPLDALVADTQGAIGYMIERSLRDHFEHLDIYRDIATIVTEVVVDPNDGGFDEPTKPIGSFYSRDEADRLAAENDWKMIDDAGRGWRRVVPSPPPVEIVQLRTIDLLQRSGVVVICCGGGGIPVAQAEDGHIRGIEAVIDKDRAAALLAVQLDAPRFVITTEVDGVYAHYGTPKQELLGDIDVERVRELDREGHFAAGSMRPKMDAALHYLNRIHGGEAIICRPSALNDALAGQAGTHIRNART